MGISRGSFESVNLGDVEKSVNPTYHERNSIASGLSAHSMGIAALTKGYDAIGGCFAQFSELLNKIGDEATKAYKASQGVMGEYTEANENFQDVQDRLSDKVANNQTLSEDDMKELKGATYRYNEASKKKQVNSYWQFNFVGDYHRFTDDESLAEVQRLAEEKKRKREEELLKAVQQNGGTM